MLVPEIEDILSLPAGFRGNQIGEVDWLKSELKKIDCPALLYTQGIFVQFAVLTIYNRLLTIGLSCYTKPQLKVIPIRLIIKVID
jgi:hypothetical protein